MASFFIYILKWAISLALLYSLYGLFLRKETFHTFNRTVLLCILVLSMVMPFCVFTTSHETFASAGFSQIETSISMYTADGEDSAFGMFPEVVATPSVDVTSMHWNVTRVILLIYSLGLVFFWIRYAVRIVVLARIIVGSRRCRDFRMPEYSTLLINNKVTVPFSWFGWIVMNETDMNETLSTILAHELTHVRHCHSADMLLCDFTANMLWFLPLSWMLRHDMRDVHEYEADKAVVLSGTNPTDYQMLLINKATGTGLQPLANGFNQCSIKKRLVMMYRKQSNKMARLKVLYILPLAGIALAAFARPAIINDVSEVLKAEEAKAPLLLPSQIVTNEAAPVSVIPTEQTAEISVTDETDELVPDDNPVIKVNVRDGDESLQMANVLILDKNNRIVAHGITDLNGNAELRIPKGGETLQVSYVGYNAFNQRISHLKQAGTSVTASINVVLVPAIDTPTIMVIGKSVPSDTADVTSVPVTSPETDIVVDTVFSIVESMPEWGDGSETLAQYVVRQIKYPELACVYHEEAIVTVEFVVDKNGSQLVTKVVDIVDRTPLQESIYDNAKKGDIYAQERINAHEDVLDQFRAEARRVVRSLAGKWTPGTQYGKPVNCKLRVPISFIMGTSVSQ